jgi:hypothetical protein
MGFWYQMRNSEEVQAQSPNKYLTFDKVRELYENTKPIRGKREKLNVRPVGERGRSWERIIKVSDDEYYLTCNSYPYHQRDTSIVKDPHFRAITFRKNYDTEVIIIHTPQDSYKSLSPSWLNSPSVLHFYHYKLPKEFSMVNHRGKKYVKHTTDDGIEHYILEKGDLVFIKRSDATAYFRPYQVHREYIRKLDKQKTKQIRQDIKPLVNYIKTMIDLVETEKWVSENPLERIPQGDLFKQDACESWFELVEIYKRKIKEISYHNDPTRGFTEKTEYKKHLLADKIHNNAYRLLKPFEITEVPIGELCYDKYRNWR